MKVIYNKRQKELLIDRVFEFNGYYFAKGKIILEANEIINIQIVEISTGLSIGDEYKNMELDKFMNYLKDCLQGIESRAINDNIHEIIGKRKVSPLYDYLKSQKKLTNAELVKRISKHKKYAINKDLVNKIKAFPNIKWTKENNKYIGISGRCRIEVLENVIKGSKLYSRIKGKEFHKTFRPSYNIKARVVKKIKKPLTVSIDEKILNAINHGMKYYDVIKTFNIKDYKPFRSLSSDKWEKIKVVK